MKMLLLELKRVAKTRSTWWLVAAALLLCIAMAFLVISFTRYYYLDETGAERHLSGFAAIEERNEMLAPMAGELTSEKIRSVFETYHEVYAEYGTEVPIEVDYERLYPINMILNRVREVFVDESTGVPLELHQISPDMAATYYERIDTRLQSYMDYLYEDHPSATTYAISLSEGITTPFVFQYGIGNSDAYEYLTICIMLLVLICTVIAAPIFSSEYASGADDILRCARHGRSRLAVVKVLATLLLGAALFAVCIGVFLFITCNAYGWDSLGTSLQMIRSSICFAPLTAGGFQSVISGAGLLSFCAIMAFTLFLSSKLKNPLVVLGIAAVVVLLPTIISFGGLGSNIENWIRLCLPSGGVGLRNGMYYEVSGFEFLTIGSLSVWSPYVLVAAAAIQIPLYTFLAVRSYTRHEVA